MLLRRLPGSFVCLHCRLQRASANQCRQLLGSTSTATPRRLGRRYVSETTRPQATRDGEIRTALAFGWNDDKLPSDKLPTNPIDPVRTEEDNTYTEAPQTSRRLGSTEGRNLQGISDGTTQDVEAGVPTAKGPDDFVVEPSQGAGQEAEAAEFLTAPSTSRFAKSNSGIPLEETPAVRDNGQATGRRHKPTDPLAFERLDRPAALELSGLSKEVADVLNSIHALQLLHNRVLPEVEFDALRIALAEGFQETQLQLYIRNYERARQGNQLSAVRQSPWMVYPLEGDSGETLVTTPSLSTQETAVDRVVTGCWGIINEAAMDRLGQLDLYLGDIEFRLLQLGSKRWLKQVAQHFTDFYKQIELHAGDRIVTIQASRPVAEAIAADLKQVLSLTKTVSHDLDLISAEPLSPETLEKVGRLTNSIVQLDPTAKKIQISWIHKVNHLENEDMSDIVLRYLLSSLGPKREVTSMLACKPKDALDYGRYVRHVKAESLPWKHRQQEWARWVTPSSMGHRPRQHRHLPKEILYKLLEFEKNFAPAVPDALPVGWSREIRSSTRAVLGHVLHAVEDHGSAVSLETTAFRPSLDRIFVPATPPIMSLKFGSYVQRNRPRHSTLLLRFLPDPDQDPALAHASPPLEVRLEVDGHDMRTLESLRAVVSSFAADVLLPQRPTDVRVEQQRFYELLGRSMHVDGVAGPYVHPLVTFLKASTVDLRHGKLKMPPLMRALPIPRRLLRPAATSGGGETAASLIPGEGHDDHTDFVPVNYRYVGREIQQAIAADFEGYTLWRRHTEAGKHGGSWSELELEDAAAARDESAAEGEEAPPEPRDPAAFIMAVARLVSAQQNMTAWRHEQRAK